MHIPSEMLSGGVCPVTAAVSVAGIAAATVFARRRGNAHSAAKFALTGATIFALQMLNYPVWGGISAHLVGGVFAAALLGVSAGVLCTALVLALQALLFADGGLDALGANILNMSLIGAGVGGLLLERLRSRGVSRARAIFAAGTLSVMLAAGALGAELLISGVAPLSAIALLLGVHIVPALVEGAATLALLRVAEGAQGDAEKSLTPTENFSRRNAFALGGILVAALAASPLASVFPDAFEWTMARFALLPDAPNFTHAPLADYAVPAVADETFSALLAGTLGGAAALALGFFAAVLLFRAKAKMLSESK